VALEDIGQMVKVVSHGAISHPMQLMNSTMLREPGYQPGKVRVLLCRLTPLKFGPLKVKLNSGRDNDDLYYLIFSKIIYYQISIVYVSTN